MGPEFEKKYLRVVSYINYVVDREKKEFSLRYALILVCSMFEVRLQIKNAIK